MPRKTLRPDEIVKLADEKGISQNRVVDNGGICLACASKKTKHWRKNQPFPNYLYSKLCSVTEIYWWKEREKKTWFVATALIFLEATRDSNIVWDSK